MAFITWNPGYSVGVYTMNDQHKILINLINEIYDGIKRGRRAEEQEKTFYELVAFAKTHFNDEERLMTYYDCPEFDLHEMLHRGLYCEIEKMYNRYIAGELGITIDLCERLKEWLIDHILQEDVRYGEHINSVTESAKSVRV
jgi:hemerythrin-like metal-binding protein